MARKPILHSIFHLASSFPIIKRSIWRLWYKYLTRLDREKQIIFMNYGFAGSFQIKLKKSDENDRHCIQLYHHAASAISLKNKDVLEIGSGRGGGSSYIARYLHPKSMVGVDFSKKAVEFCRKNYSSRNLSFNFGDAESLAFEDNKFDVVINVESSHCYGDMARFLKEVSRVLRQGGYFLFADFRYREDMNNLRKQLTKSGFRIMKEEEITGNVMKSLEINNGRKLNIIRQKVPKPLQKAFYSFAGIKGTPIYGSFRDGRSVYFNFVLRKS